MPWLQKAVDLAHDIRESLPFLSVYIDQSCDPKSNYASVWISQTAEKNWWENKDVIPVFNSDVRYLCKQYRIFTDHFFSGLFEYDPCVF